MSFPPKSIVYLRPDTIGDLVLFSAALAQLRQAWPEARHTVLVRKAYLPVAELLPEGIEWLGTDVNPFTQDAFAATEPFAATLAALTALQPDLLVAATLNRTWLEAALAGQFPQARRVSLGRKELPERFATALHRVHGLELAQAFSEWVDVPADRTDGEANQQLVAHLLGHPPTPQCPAVRISAEAHVQAAATLQRLQVSPRQWVAVFVGGIANVQLKTWPAARFAELVVALRERGWSPVLLAQAIERPLVDEVNAALSGLGAPAAPSWLGQDGQLPLLAALFATARAYVGHDTGAMHLAAAAACPTLGIFGGGHWPRFRPQGRQAFAVVQPLPCFGCGWDCIITPGLCVKSLATTSILRAFDALIAAGEQDIQGVEEASDVPASTRELIAAVRDRLRSLHDEGMKRQLKIEELKRETSGKDVEIAALKDSAEERKQEMESIKAELEAECRGKDGEISQLKREADAKDQEIVDLKGFTDDLKLEIKAIKEELEGECATKDVEIGQLKDAANVKDSEIESLKQICNEREALIITQDGHIKHFQAVLKDHELQFASKDERLAVFERHFAALPSDASTYAQALHDKDVHIRNLESMLRNREEALAEHRAHLQNYEQGLYALEAFKVYNRHLAEKEAVLQVLNQACVERERVIQQLALQNVGLGRLHKFWISVREHFRLRYGVPLSQWFFRKMVEEYPMQIGVLRHHEPRPLRWERLPKPRAAEATWPQIGIVTPSYGQAAFIETTMVSVLNQQYPKLHYVVQDGASRDASPAIIARYADRLTHWESVPDRGQADAVRLGFLHLEGKLGDNDLMAWLNSDDFLAPKALATVADYFARHPDIDVVYGHRILVDGEDREIGRWIMPPHDPATLEWIDYVPQETLFWRKRLWDRVGGIDPTFRFALDWDLLARFQLAGAKMVRLPYALGCFRVHAEQKTSQQIHTIGNEEMIRVRRKFHGDQHTDHEKIQHFARKARLGGALSARLLAWGLRSTRF